VALIGDGLGDLARVARDVAARAGNRGVLRTGSDARAAGVVHVRSLDRQIAVAAHHSLLDSKPGEKT